MRWLQSKKQHGSKRKIDQWSAEAQGTDSVLGDLWPGAWGLRPWKGPGNPKLLPLVHGTLRNADIAALITAATNSTAGDKHGYLTAAIQT